MQDKRRKEDQIPDKHLKEIDKYWKINNLFMLKTNLNIKFIWLKLP